jgi:sterol desaturase/sphingolipid hydroxylase (fatty acid hydroxylase superfamily)
MTEAEFQVGRAVTFVAAVGLAFLFQRVAPHARLSGSWRVNGSLWLIDAVVVGGVCGACGFTAAQWATREGIGVFNLLGVGRAAAILPVILFLDLVSYAWHRANHRVPILWRLHQVHHSDPTFTVSTGARFHPGELLLSLPVRLAAVVLVGASPEAVLAFEAMFAVANFVEHGDIDLPDAIERRCARLLVTPALHRRHHTRSGPDRDRNFGTVFSFWDRFFATYRHNDSATVVDTGLPGLERVTLSAAILLPLRRPAA